MFTKLRERMNEKGSLPAVMGAMILISAASLLLASYAVAGVKSSELRAASNRLSAGISSCETILIETVQKQAPTASAPGAAMNNQANTYCNWATNYGGAKVTIVGGESGPKQYTTPGSPRPTHVEVSLLAESPTGESLTQKKYIPYAPENAVVPPPSNSYVTGFDADGKAIWSQ